MLAVAAVSERARREGAGHRGRGGFRGRVRCARGRSSAHRGRRRRQRPEPGRFGVQVGSGSGVRAIPNPRRPNFPYWIFPSRPRRRPNPGFQTRRAAKIARGWISMSLRADQAGQLGSNPRPTAEGPGSGRTLSPGLSPSS